MILKDFFKKNDASAEKLKEIQNERFVASRALEDNYALVRSLGMKIDDLKPRLPGLLEAQAQAERLKKDALLAFAVEQISYSEMERARDMAEAAKRTQEESIELLEALEKAKVQAERAIPALQSVKTQADGAFWLIVLEDLKSQLDEAARELFISAYAAHRQAYPGRLPSLGSFLKVVNSKGLSFDLHTPQGMATLDIESKAKIKELEEAYS
jgi:flagellar biosynthesis regulator FlaF